jgi:hypothetical protein
MLSAWQLTNMPYPHIARARWARPWIIVSTVLWIGGVVIGTLAYPHHYYFVRIMLYAGSVSFVALAVARTWRDYRARRAPAS